MIPKKIHYCWFGKKTLPMSATKCIDSWKKYMPEAEIIRWDESNYDVNKLQYTREAYENGKYAFVSDVARLEIIFSEGGIYFDTDVELIKPIDSLLHESCFMGFQTKSTDGNYYVNTGLGFGAEKGNLIIDEMLKEYNTLSFVESDGSLNTLSCPVRNTSVLQQKGLILNNTKQLIGSVSVYPVDYFCPIDEKSGVLNITENTYSIHHFDASWLNTRQKAKRKLRQIIGVNRWETLKKILG